MYDKEKRKQYLENSKEKVKEQKRLWYEANKEKMRLYQKDWQKNNKVKLREYGKTRLQKDPLFKLKTNLKNLIGNSFRNNNIQKKSKTEEILGCTYQELKIHLETQFQPWMNWDNRGLYNGELDYGWDIDHIIPLSSAETSIDLIRLNHYTNLQPLCSYTNRHIKMNNVDN